MAVVITVIRHCHTNYDELLMNGCERPEARRQVRDAVDDVLKRWRLPNEENRQCARPQKL